MARLRKHDPEEAALSERMTLIPTDHSGCPHERAHYDRFWREAVIGIYFDLSSISMAVELVVF